MVVMNLLCPTDGFTMHYSEGKGGRKGSELWGQVEVDSNPSSLQCGFDYLNCFSFLV